MTPEKTDPEIRRMRKERDRRVAKRKSLRHRIGEINQRIKKLNGAIKRRLDRLNEGGAKKACKWALAQVGTAESPWGSNSGPKISDWIRAGGGVPGWAWCQYFANVVAVHGGCPQGKSGYTPFVLGGGYAPLGWKKVPIGQEEPGDFVYFKFPGVSNAACDHVGVYIGNGQTVEGNTSPGTSGSQNNGGGVYIRTRSKSLWAGVVRPPYDK